MLFVQVLVNLETLPPLKYYFSFAHHREHLRSCPAARPFPPNAGIHRLCSPWMPSHKHKPQKLSTKPKHINFIALRIFGVVFSVLNRGNCWPCVTPCAAVHSLRRLKC